MATPPDSVQSAYPLLATNSTYQGVALDAFSARGREDKLQNKLTGPNDREFLQIEQSLHVPKQHYNCAPYHDEWVDQRPETLEALGRDAIFLYGHDGNTINHRMEVHFSVTITVGAGNVESFETVPYFGERLLGDMTLQYANGTLRHHSASCLHVRNRLTADVTTEMDAAYKEHIVAQPVVIAAGESKTITGWCPVWAPWSVDGENPLVINALPEKMKLRHAIPEGRYLYRRGEDADQMADQTNVVTVTLNSLRLRQHTTIVPKVERAALVNMTMRPRGRAWHYLDVESIEEVALRCEDINQTDKIVRQQMRLIRNPVAYSAIILRYQRDMEAVSTAGWGAQLDAYVVANTRPDWTRFVPIKEWYLAESGQQLGPRYTLRYFESELRPRLFKNGAYNLIAVLPHTRYPLLESAGLGHVTYNNMNEPEIFIVYDESFDGDAIGLPYTNRFAEVGADNPSETADLRSADKRADYYSFSKGIAAQEKGNLIALLRH
jgi:hypothetical protein